MDAAEAFPNRQYWIAGGLLGGCECDPLIHFSSSFTPPAYRDALPHSAAGVEMVYVRNTGSILFLLGGACFVQR